tara:strand:- start:1171 stop:1455 length:285 start_codon:yes stop_codon:yes gene_type:complete
MTKESDNVQEEKDIKNDLYGTEEYGLISESKEHKQQIEVMDLRDTADMCIVTYGEGDELKAFDTMHNKICAQELEIDTLKAGYFRLLKTYHDDI